MNDHPGVPHEDIETGVRGEAKIDKSAETRGKGSGQGRFGGVDGLDPAVIEIAEEVLAAIFRGPTQVLGCEGPTDDACRRVVVDRPTKARVGGRAVLDDGPTVVGARDALVDFFRLPSNVVNKYAVR